MKIVEVRIHTIKDNNEQPTSGGIALAGKIAQGIEIRKFSRFICAPNQRCRETMIVFGVPEDLIEEDERFNPLPDEKISFHHQKGAEIKEVGGFFRIPELQPLLTSVGQRVLEAIKEIAQKLPEGGQALVISHGGAIVPAAHLVKEIDFTNFKKIPDCGGIRFQIENNEIIGYEIIIPGIV